MEFSEIKVTAVKRMLDPKLVDKAVYQSINDVAKEVDKENILEMKKDYNISPKRIRQNIRRKRATPSRPYSVITFTGRPPGLQHYGAKQRVAIGGGVTNLSVSRKSGGLVGKRMKRGKASAVTVAVIKGQRRQIKGAFLQVMPGGGIGIFRRTGEGSTPAEKRKSIERLHGPSVRGMFKARKGLERSNRVVNAEYPSLFKKRYSKMLRRVKR